MSHAERRREAPEMASKNGTHIGNFVIEDNNGCGIVGRTEARAETDDDRRMQEEWLAACERNQGYAPGAHPARRAISISRALSDSRTGADQAEVEG